MAAAAAAADPPPSSAVAVGGRWGDLSRVLGLQFRFQVWSIAQRGGEEEGKKKKEIRLNKNRC